jgi:Na+-transporting NADH:ubiquinone oxidoreductase subunit C
VSKFSKNSNGYILMYAMIMTLVLGTVLASVSEVLKPKQTAEKDFEQMKFILASALGMETVNQLPRNEVTDMYNELVKDFVVDPEGERQEGLTAEDVNVGKEYKKPKPERLLPVYSIAKENQPEEVAYYVVPVYGFGLWDNIWGYVALESDLATIKGVIFDHKAETPGLGARITENEIQQRFVGKKLLDASGDFQSIVMQKGEGNNYDDNPHKVDGLSGATLTAVGVNNMFRDYFKMYYNFFNTLK